MLMNIVIKCHSVKYAIFNAKLTLFGMTLLRQLDIYQDNITRLSFTIAGLMIKLKETSLTLSTTVICGWF